jgi:hypothetical protein
LPSKVFGAGLSEQALQDVAQAVAAADAFDLRQPSGEQ